MAVKVVWRKDQLVKITQDGTLRERKILGYPLEKTPLSAYSNIFYWSHVVSDYGCTITDKPIVGFEIFTYVLKGTYETYHRDTDTWNLLREGDIEIIQAGKGTRYSEKIHPGAEILKIWFDPGFDIHQRINPLQTSYKKVSLRQKSISDRETTIINDKNNSGKFYSKDVSIRIEQVQPGLHIINNEKDFTLSAYILNGYMDIRQLTLSFNDFFTVNDKCELRIQALSECKLLIVTSPLQPEYMTYRQMYV